MLRVCSAGSSGIAIARVIVAGGAGDQDLVAGDDRARVAVGPSRTASRTESEAAAQALRRLMRTP